MAFGFPPSCLGAAELKDVIPSLLPGEGLVLRGPDGTIKSFGVTDLEQPMGSLAKLVWLRLEGASWSARSVTYTCSGSMGAWHCWNREGHGKVDLEKASERSCNLAFLAWIQDSAKQWRTSHGEATARARLEAGFSPFLGQRLDPGEGLPTFGPEWIGDGDLLRTSPQKMLAWLLEPTQAPLLLQCRSLLSQHSMEAGWTPSWWIKTGTAPALDEPGATSAWVVGSNGETLAVLHLPRGRGKEQGLFRFHTILEPILEAPWVEPGPDLQAPEGPRYVGSPEAQERLELPLQAAIRSTEAYGPLLTGLWEVHLHEDALTFEHATGAPPGRAALWVGRTLHLRPWRQLQRRDLGAILRHEVVHRRLQQSNLRPWEEEARCLFAEGHVRPPQAWPVPPSHAYQDRLDRALRRGATVEQAWAYGALRSWIAGQTLPVPPNRKEPVAGEEAWADDPPISDRIVTLSWPPERLPMHLQVNGKRLGRVLGQVWRFNGQVSFGKGTPFKALEGQVEATWAPSGWRVSWSVPASTWIAAATSGELGDETPLEARRALASLLRVWLEAHPRGNHPDGTFCPLTHCAVVRGVPSASTLRAAATAPPLALEPSLALFCGSKGGVSLSPREVWGDGSSVALAAPKVPGDRWADWNRRLSPSQTGVLKETVKPGLRPGQKGIFIGVSGPYPVEDLRLATGRAFGWTLWPSNACEVSVLEGGGLAIRGHGWGHNVGMCLATALFRAREGWKAEQILEEAFRHQTP